MLLNSWRWSPPIVLILAALFVACTSTTTPNENTEGSSGGAGSGGLGSGGSASEAGPGACATKACGDHCDTCEWGACAAGDAAPHELQCNASGKCQYISMTNTPPACAGPIQCGDASCGSGFSCHCMFSATKRCCPIGTVCEPCE